ncbi:MAG: ROK family protein, partial [Candidatus Omnitrophica bacterium]|nr:ROK family protein [Candidatus Omnitrophota bacterium]
DAKLMCLAEHKLGRAKGALNALCLTLGTGVGGGIIAEGELYRGSDNAAGEVGHMPINSGGRRCNCGGRGCLEAYVGNRRIESEARKVFKRPVSLEELSHLANVRDRRALGVWRKAGKDLGVALCGVVNLLNPERIVIGGGVAQAGKVLFDKIKETVSQQAMGVQARRVRIVKSKLGKDAGLIGAAVMVREGLRI